MTNKAPNSIDAYVGSRVRLQRLVRGFSQEKLGEHLGVTFQQVQKYEKGTNRIGASRLQHIAQVLGVPVSFFFQQEETGSVEMGGLGDGTSTSGDISAFMATREGLSLNQAFMSIGDAKIRRAILALVKSVAEGGSAEFLPATGDKGDTSHAHN
ncbi:helix-turn-helix domain-containing protein [Rhizobium sp. TRM95111]|uniref:helix-turn-helix domain-containing protein n=1 Tax=Rhizobium alarense TaxID=2846851 RepID=UPI001F208C24|nr:helix-turn-helix domain-containing protein [Rhizobium alarense]MCF3640588.1 helix-turn-helix domain-containing protein [Rhizobium alarense]